MDFIDSIRALGAKVKEQKDRIQTEEATKNAFIMPFIQALGYDVFNPAEVVPEFVADFGMKKGEKVDYAVFAGGKPAILFECKSSSTNLDVVHASQLSRYFTQTDARIGVLTNGVIYRFFSDLEKLNKMDERPFLEFNILDVQEDLVEELKRFTKGAFDLERILDVAGELKYTREILGLLAQEFKAPSDDFVRFFASRAYSGNLTVKVREQFQAITQDALQQFINDRVNDRLKSALESGKRASPEESVEEDDSDDEEGGPQARGVETTVEELQAYYIVKAIVGGTTDRKRIVMRDKLTHCGVLLDDTNRKPICHFRFRSRGKTLVLFDAQKNKERVAIQDLDDIYKYADRLKDMVRIYDGQ